MTVIQQWTGADATALRLAMRLSLDGFSAKLGASLRTVAKWSAQPGTRPTPQYQAVLDTVLERLDPPARQRFDMLIAQSQPPELPPPGSVSGLAVRQRLLSYRVREPAVPAR